MEITQELLHDLFEYRDGELYWKVKLANRIKVGDIAGSAHHSGYKELKIRGKQYRLHRIIFCMFNGYFPEYIDHINNNPADNRIENLRECSLQQNQFNRKMSKNNTSGYKGVSWDSSRKNWVVNIYLNAKKKYFGGYKDLELAVLVAEEARLKYHGEFANHGNKNEVNS